MPGNLMICVRAPLVKYSSVQELVLMCAEVLDEYTRQVDTVLRDIWTEQHVKTTLVSTKNRGAIYACTMHREICMRLDTANRDYIRSTAEPDRAHLVNVLHRVLTDIVLMGHSSHLMRVMTQNFYRCRDATGDTWLICPRHKLSEYTLAMCMSQHRRLGVEAELNALSEDILRNIARFLFSSTSWDSHPMDSQVEVKKVPV